jgi:AcrR family transcriptional regulator
MTTAEKPVPLRERKRARTRALIIEVAQKLFTDQGYEATTLEQICEAAEVSVPTLLAYFESKDRLALAVEVDALETFRVELEDPERSEDTLTLWRVRIADAAEHLRKNRRQALLYMRFTQSSNSVLRGYLQLLTEYEELLGRSLARDYGTDYDTDVPTRLLATNLVWGNRAVLRQWVESGGRSDPDALIAVVDFAIEQFPKPSRKSSRATGSAKR